MSIIKGKGAPGSKTKGAIGDTYINELTGQEYKCTNACTITIHSGSTSSYAWEKVEKAENEVKDTAPVEEVKEEVVETENEEVVVEEEETPVEEVEEEVPENKSNRTNYNAISNKKDK